MLTVIPMISGRFKPMFWCFCSFLSLLRCALMLSLVLLLQHCWIHVWNILKEDDFNVWNIQNLNYQNRLGQIWSQSMQNNFIVCFVYRQMHLNFALKSCIASCKTKLAVLHLNTTGHCETQLHDFSFSLHRFLGIIYVKTCPGK